MINYPEFFDDASIRKYYDVVFQSSQIRAIEEAKVIVIGEIHNVGVHVNKTLIDLSEKCRKLNAILLKTYAKEGSILSVEGDESMEDTESNESLEARFERTMKVTDEYNDVSIKEIPREQLCKFLRKLHRKILKEDYCLDDDIYARFAKIFGWDLYSDYELAPETLNELKQKNFDLKGDKRWSVIFGMLDRERHHIHQEILDAKKNHQDTADFLKIKEFRIGEIATAIMKIAAETFPVRTKNMVNTNRLIRSDKSFIGNVIFMAGAAHVKHDNEFDPNHSINLLYKELEEAKGVALVPKLVDDLNLLELNK